MHTMHEAVKVHPHFVFKGQALKKGVYKVSFTAANAAIKVNTLHRRCGWFATKQRLYLAGKATL